LSQNFRTGIGITGLRRELPNPGTIAQWLARFRATRSVNAGSTLWPMVFITGFSAERPATIISREKTGGTGAFVKALNYRTGADVAGGTTGRGAAEIEAKSSCSFCRAGKHGVALRTTQTRRRS
jgi:hypothetical protein